MGARTIAPAPALAPGQRYRALGLGVLTSGIWASSFVIIKVGLRDASPLTLGGMRYVAGFLLFLPLLPLLPAERWLPDGGARAWLALAGVGLLAYPIANGLLFPALEHLDVTAASFVFNQSPLIVLLLGIVTLAEWPTGTQVLGFAVLAGGAWLFFGTPGAAREPVWLLAIAGSAAAFAAYSVGARHLARDGRLGSIALTAWPLAIGGAVLLAIGLAAEGPPRPSWALAAVVAWLALVNTSLAYLAWSRALRHLQAFEVNVFLGVSPMITALLAWPVLGQRPSPVQLVAIAIATAGIVLVQAGFRRRRTA